MKNILLFFCLFALNRVTLAQTYYIRLEDASGINTDRYQDSLEMAAADLMHAFPSDAYRDSFRVYDFGFYLHQETYKGGYPETMLQKIEEIQANGTPYYLLFGKQTDKTGIYTKIWVELKLPTTRKFSCLTEDQRKFLRINLHGITNSSLYQPDKSYLLYAKSEKRAIDSLKSMITKIVDCCYNADNSNCTQCLTPEGIQTYLLEQGFIAIPIKILGNATLRDSSNVSKRPSGRVTDCAQKSIEIDGVVIPDLGEVVDNILSCYGDPNVKAVITDGDCNCAGEVTKGLLGEIVLSIHIWKPPYFAQIRGQGDIMYVWTKNPDKLGTLPFKGHFPLKTGYTPSDWYNPIYVKSVIENIYLKNGFSLASVDTDDPVVLKRIDIYNFIGLAPAVQYSMNLGRTYPGTVNCEHKRSGFINLPLFNEFYSKVYKNKISSNFHKNYIVGHTVAHEFMHGIIGECIFYFKNTLRQTNIAIIDIKDGHCIDKRNLMFPGDSNPKEKDVPFVFPDGALEKKAEKEAKNFLGEDQPYQEIFDYILWASDAGYPKSITSSLNSWEVIPANFKDIISIFMLLYAVDTKFSTNSCELKIAAEIVFKKFNKFNLTKNE